MKYYQYPLEEKSGDLRFLERASRSSDTGLLSGLALPETAAEWEECIRDQATSHPRVMIAVGLLAGITLGLWMKR